MPEDHLTPSHSFVVSLGHTGRRGVVLGHTLNTHTLRETDEQKKVSSKFTIFCWATFIPIPGCTRPMGRRLDTPRATAGAKCWTWQIYCPPGSLTDCKKQNCTADPVDSPGNKLLNFKLLNFSVFLKIYCIDYAITVVPFPPPHSIPSCTSPPSHIPPL